MRLLIYDGSVLCAASIQTILTNLTRMVYDDCVINLCGLYNAFLELIKQQESSDREEPGAEGVLMNDCDTYIHYTINEDYDIIINKVVW